jgi:hypothetical protein
MTAMSEPLLTIPEAARELGMTADEALHLIESRELPAVRGADGGAYVRVRDLEQYRETRASA